LAAQAVSPTAGGGANVVFAERLPASPARTGDGETRCFCRPMSRKRGRHEYRLAARENVFREDRQLKQTEPGGGKRQLERMSELSYCGELKRAP
jgi:hypothetical protein